MDRQGKTISEGILLKQEKKELNTDRTKGKITGYRPHLRDDSLMEELLEGTVEAEKRKKN